MLVRNVIFLLELKKTLWKLPIPTISQQTKNFGTFFIFPNFRGRVNIGDVIQIWLALILVSMERETIGYTAFTKENELVATNPFEDMLQKMAQEDESQAAEIT